MKESGIMLRFLILFCCAATLTASGCATTGKSSPGTLGGRLSLEQWVDREAVPYLIRELGDNPRFKGQPFLLVSMNRDNVEADIDELTMQIRESITDGLLTKPGMGLVWRPPAKPWTHHTQVKQADCTGGQKEAIYVGIDASLSSLDGDLHVTIRALDIAEKQWITGFGIAWQGHASSMQKKALSSKKTDDFLLGLRPLPFNENQADLLAAYVSRNLSCLFSNMDLDEAVVYVEKDNPGKIRYFDNAFGLVANYIASYKEVTVTDDPSKANIRLLARVHDIHQGLYQVWVTPRYKMNNHYVPGKETQAYVALDNPVSVQPPAPVKKSPPPKKPEPSQRSGNVLDVCFLDFRNSIENRFYPMLKTYPGAVRVRQIYDRCDTYGACICYELTVRDRQSQRMEELTMWMKKSLIAQDITRFKLETRSPEQLRVTFFTGFD